MASEIGSSTASTTHSSHTHHQPKQISFDQTQETTETTKSKRRRVSQRFTHYSFHASHKKQLDDPSHRHCELDDEEGKNRFFLVLLLEGIEDSVYFFGCSVVGLVAWSVVCAYVAEGLRERAVEDPEGEVEQWLEDIENCRWALGVIGTLFVFTLVFRFNACYDRWWEGRTLWGDLISKCIELAMMNRRWIKDENLNRRLSRFLISFTYATKSLLRGRSLAEPNEDGPRLVERGLLTQTELDDMHDHPCWQPHYCLEVLRAIIMEAHIHGEQCLILPEVNKTHGQLFRCFDNTIKDLNKLVGGCARIRSSGLPASYDAITLTTFFLYFVLASVVWSVAIGWKTPIVIFIASVISVLLIVMGTNLVNPFGYDRADLPLEAFCSTIEAQINAIDERSKSRIIRHIAQSSTSRTRESGESAESRGTVETARDSGLVSEVSETYAL